VDEHGVTGGNAVALKEITLAYNDAGQITSIDRYENGQLAVEAITAMTAMAGSLAWFTTRATRS